jgi:ribosomal protein S18 acetylase RimI-like enzyme
MSIRVAVAADVPELVRFNQAMALETEGKGLDPATIEKGVSAVFGDANKGFYVVAEDESKIVGGLMVTFEWSDWRNAWFWWIQSVYILPEARGRRLYSQMYDFVKDMARVAGNVCGFRLYVEKDNHRAQKVYEAVGMGRSYYLMFEEPLKENRGSPEKGTPALR